MNGNAQLDIDRLESVRIKCPNCGMPYDVPASLDRWSCDCGESWRLGDDPKYGWEQTIYNRPARVEAVYSDQAKVRWQDNNTLGFVPITALGKEVGCDA